RRFTRPDRGSTCERITIYPRFPGKFLPRVLESGKLTFRHLELPARRSLLLAVVHLSNKLHQSTCSQTQALTPVRYAIEQAEASVSHERTILVGDWNLDPFEAGMVGAAGAHAVMTRPLAEQRAREIDGANYRFFYNPMWGRFGDTTPGPPGSYY